MLKSALGGYQGRRMMMMSFCTAWQTHGHWRRWVYTSFQQVFLTKRFHLTTSDKSSV